MRALAQAACAAFLGAVACALQGCGEPGPAPSPSPAPSGDGGETGAPAGRFENWILGLMWQPACSLPDCGSDKRVLKHLSSSSYAAEHLSLHGLWPEYDPSLHHNLSWPQFCKGPVGSFEKCEASERDPLCRPPRDALAKYNTTADWQTFALGYAWGGLSTHEWSKHGSCTGWNASYYFEVEISTYKRALKLPGPLFIESKVGKKVSQKQLLAAFGGTATFGCHRCMLTDIFLAFAADNATLLPLGVANSTDPDLLGSCAVCSHIEVLAWKGCPTPPPQTEPRGLVV
ncbi:rna [Symbiodinium natans]|uniref:Rna protein n=1 Tax=Symbiodinium natans TaxID=878477 RepID=A0A812UX91_9DINO|nr:rna [Symbiodinium natans]